MASRSKIIYRGMCGSVEETVFNANMEVMVVIESRRNAI